MSSRLVGSNIVYDLAAIGTPMLRPDGTALVYAHGEADPGADSHHSRLRLVSLDAGEARWLTRGPADRCPVWSPDGTMVAFLRPPAAGAPPQVWVLPLAGGEARCISELDHGVGELAWSPDGRTIVCVADVDVAADGARRNGVREVRGLHYRHDDIGWRAHVRRQLFAVEVATGATRQLTDGDFDHARPSFCPDGSTLAFCSDRSAARQLREPDGSELCLMPSTGGPVRRLVRDEFGIATHAWSADGEQLAYVATEAELRWQSTLCTVDVKTGATTRLSPPELLPQTGFYPVIDPPAPVWHDEAIVFVADARASSGLYRAHGGTVEPLRRERELVLGMSASGSGERVALLTSRLDRPAELVLVEVARSTARAVPAVIPALSQTRRLATVVRRGVRSDPWTIDAWVVRPPGFDPGRRYPLVLDIHGGPNSFFATAFNPLHQLLATRGFVVVFANPRGSTSYGPEFTAAVLRDWGGGDYRDLMAVVERISAEPWIDADRVGVHGYSYGGYMAAWMVGQTDRFRAAIAGAPITDMASFYGTTDIAASFAEQHFGGTPAEAHEWYREHSPLTYATRISTPLLLLHGESDLRCPIGQSEQLYALLTRLGKPVEFVRFPGASHMLRFTAPLPLQQEYLCRVVDWFERWLPELAAA